MTDPTPDTLTVPVVVPEGRDAVDGLTLKELSMASQAVKCDVVAAAKGRDPHGAKKYAALTQIVLAWSRRLDPTAKAEDFDGYTGDDLAHALRWDEAPPAPTADPTAPQDASQ